jgi:hypothetical protein
MVLPFVLWYGDRFAWESAGGDASVPESGTSYLSWWPWRDLLAAQRRSFLAGPKEGGIFRPIPGGIADLWTQESFVRRAWQFAVGGGSLILAELFILTLSRKDPLVPRSLVWSAADLQAWAEAYVLPIDWDMGIALFSFLLVLMIKRSWLLGLRSLVLATTLGIGLSTIGILVGDLLFLPGEARSLFMASRILLWWEALILAISILASYQILLVLTPLYLPRLWTRISRFVSKGQDAKT